MRDNSLWLAIGVCILSAGGVAAQGAEHLADALVPGRRAIATEVRTGAAGTTFGIWKVVAPDRARGLFATVSVLASHNENDSNSVTNSSFSATIGPRVRRYLAHEGPVAGFGEAGIAAGARYQHASYSSSPGAAATSGHEWHGLLGADMGIGAEWFPLSRVSLSLRTGIQLNGDVGHVVVPGGASYTAWAASGSTFVSSVMAQLYF